MIDGIKFTCEIENFDEWNRSIGVDFKLRITLHGQIAMNIIKYGSKQKFVTHYFASLESYKLSVIKTEIGKDLNHIESVSYRLIVKGSFHKNHFRSIEYPSGANFQPFTYDQLQAEILNICNKLSLDLSKAKIQNLEVGINLPVDFNVMEYFQKNLLLYKVKTFEPWGEKRGVSIGFQCKLSQFSVKLYDKALQFGLAKPLMRFELRILRMQKLKKHKLKYLIDLCNQSKVTGLLKELLDSWNQVLIHDERIDSDDQKPEDRTFIEQCLNINFWRTAIKCGYPSLLKAKNRFQAIQQKNNSDFKNELHKKIIVEWNASFQGKEYIPEPNGRCLNKKSNTENFIYR